ncbi:Aquaporin NIP1-1 [Vitis vinifera]|uniref:Aquaporin NIP1-1 n=1 Tax=Vitis vinifera TaxID=29760 RepID=A0A438HNH4_VITVI|nr:Aquaporin NIP1-1 [Vitis vinifera]
MTNQKRTHERWKNHGFEMEIDLLCRKPSVGYRDNEGHFGWTQINQPILRGSGIGSSEVGWWRRFRLRPSALVTLLGTVIWLVTILVPPYVISQVAGSSLAILTLLVMLNTSIPICATINELSGVTVGATVLVNVLLAGPITGASMNPARSIGPALVSMEFDCLWILHCGSHSRNHYSNCNLQSC